MGHAAHKFVVVERHALVRVEQPEDLHGRREELLGEGLVGQPVGLALRGPFGLELGELLF